jgi:hypothetical protein
MQSEHDDSSSEEEGDVQPANIDGGVEGTFGVNDDVQVISAEVLHFMVQILAAIFSKCCLYNDI